MEELKCPNCGAPIEDFVMNVGTCSFCGTKVNIPNSSNEDTFLSSNDLVIPEGVVEIENEKYKDNKYIKRIVIPSSVKKIGVSAFENCENLEEVIFSSGIEKIQNRAFRNTSIKELDLPETLEEVGNEAFMECKNLSKLRILTKKSTFLASFKKCSSLENVDCDINDFYPSLKKSTETPNKSDRRSTFFDVFQGTPFLNKIEKAYSFAANRGICFVCGGEIKKSVFGYGKCLKCGCDYSGIKK